MKASELTFGLKLERDAPLWWGARALFERQSRYPLDRKDQKAAKGLRLYDTFVAG